MSGPLALIPPKPSRDRLPEILARLPGLVAVFVRSESVFEVAGGQRFLAKLDKLARAAELGLEAQNRCAEARLRVERRLGQLLLLTVHPGRPRKTVGPHDHFADQRALLREIGISKDLSARAQKLAQIQETRFERFFQQCRKFGWEITYQNLCARVGMDSVNEYVRQREEISERTGHNPQRQPSPEMPLPKLRPPRLILGDCLKELPKLPDRSIDLILPDLPWGSTYDRLKWDRPIDLDALFPQLWRILIPGGAIVVFANQSYASVITHHQQKRFRYEIIWNSGAPRHFVHAKHHPLQTHYNIEVFSQGTMSAQPRSKLRMAYYPENHNEPGYPKSVVDFPRSDCKWHPMEKPIPLLRWLIELHSLRGQTVLDFCMGSGSTGVAARECGRNFIGIEIDRDHLENAKHRLNVF
jgi:site-specific DNA-methyltransferase (adenine-specific)